MKSKLTRKQAEERINSFFKSTENKSPEQIKKIKRLAMHYNIKLKDERKKFCKKCFSTKLKVLKIKKGIKSVKCENCGKIFRWNIK